jgi:hypothetical protein
VGSINTRLGNNEGATIGVKFPSDYFNLSEEYLAIKAPNDNVMHSPNTTYKSDKSVLMFVINYIH